MVDDSNKERISNRLKGNSIRIKNNMRKEMLNCYYSVENGTWLCDKARLFQS